MMILAYSVTSVALGVLSVSLAILILIIAYRKLLGYLGKGSTPKEKYAVLYSIEIQPSKGVVDFYYELEEEKEVELALLNENMDFLQTLDKRTAKIGGNKVPFDTTTLANGPYFFELRTENQKTAKKIRVENP